MALTTPLFSQHSRRFQANRYVYPVISRRSRGLSIGINLNVDAICNFDCVYCSVDRRGPAPAPPGTRIDAEHLARELEELLQAVQDGSLFATPPFDRTPAALRRLNDIALSGDGEPTSSPAFPAVCELMIAARTRHALPVRLVVITNATLLDRPAVQAALARLDQHGGEIWAKLDAGTQGYYEQVVRSRIPLAQVLANLLLTARLRPIVIQSLFMRLHGQGPDAAEIAAYGERLRTILAAGGRIDRVQIYTTARHTAEAFVAALTVQELEAIAATLRPLGCAVEVFPASLDAEPGAT